MRQPWVWVDLENTPHVLFLEPLGSRLRDLGWQVRFTARQQSQTIELAALRGIPALPIGAGDFHSAIAKVLGVTSRAFALGAWILRHGRPRLLLSCSRSASLVAWALRIPGIVILDYEHAETRSLALGNKTIWFPDVLRDAPLPSAVRRIAQFFPGLKENLYLDNWNLDYDRERQTFGIDNGQYLVVSRPPAESAHYASRTSMELWLVVIKRLGQRGVRTIIVARSEAQRNQIRDLLGSEAELLVDAVSGPSLIAAADLVVGGGGTMIREAAVLGVPAWSVFCGPTAAVDVQLAAEGRLRWVRTEEELEQAFSAPLPIRNPRRGPYEEGLSMILADVKERLRPGNES